MSVCTFLACDYPLPNFSPKEKYPIEINIDNGTIYDGGADDNFYLYSFSSVNDYTEKKYAVELEWNYTNGRDQTLIKYIKEVLEKTDSIEFWHVWLEDYYEYEERPRIKKRKISITEITVEDIEDLINTQIWNIVDRHLPSRPNFYCLEIVK